jgi:hypothetical protein
MADQLPDHVIEGRPQVVDGVAHYERQPGWDRFLEFDANRWLTSFGMITYRQTVGLSFDKKVKLPFKLIDVMIGPFDL